MQRTLLVVAFVILIVLDFVGVSSVLAFGGIGLAFAAVGRGGMWVPSLLIGVIVDACLIWLTILTARRVRPTQ